jgi:hypothetical protein
MTTPVAGSPAVRPAQDTHVTATKRETKQPPAKASDQSPDTVQLSSTAKAAVKSTSGTDADHDGDSR